MNSKKILILIIGIVCIILVFGVILFIFSNNKKNNNNIENNIIATDKTYDVNMTKEMPDEKYRTIENECNQLEIKGTTQERLINEYLEDYKNNALNFTDDAYELLDKQYREAKFGSIEEYKQYINNNKSEIEDIELSKYQANETDDCTEYICIDQYNSYYIFHVTNPGSYTLFLDTYTVDLPEFAEKYNKASEQEKVVLNINKIITALNAKDYHYIYSKLAYSFKNNYFQNQEILERYLRENINEKVVVSYDKFSKQGNLYTYEIRITDEGIETYLNKKMNIVMQLNEGTDFVMSFSIEEE